MTYIIGNRYLRLDNSLSEEERRYLLDHQKVFELCLINVSVKYIKELQKIVNLYSDIFIIYDTLLSKIPDYDDITLLIKISKNSLTISENELNRYVRSIQNQALSYMNYAIVRMNIERLLQVVSAIIPKILEGLNGIQIFFGNFDNLKKLLIPFLYEQSKDIQFSLSKALYCFKLKLDFEIITEITDFTLSKLKKVEKITTALEKETAILHNTFSIFDPSVSRYSQALLGKAILKRDIPYEDCTLIRRRDICFHAAEHIVSIPLASDKVDNSLYNFIYYAALFFVVFIGFLVLRLIGILSK